MGNVDQQIKKCDRENQRMERREAKIRKRLERPEQLAKDEVRGNLGARFADDEQR